MRKISLICFFSAALALLSGSLSAQITWEKLFSKKSTDAFRHVVEVPAGGYILAGYTADSTVSDTDAYVVRMTTSGDTLWTRRINGSNNRKDLFYKVINTDDGGFAFCGYTTNNGAGNDDAYWVKMDSNGTIQWSKYWGGSGKDRAQDIIQTSDGGYAIVGYTTSPPSAYYDAILIRTNSSGDTLWTKLYGTGGYEDANSVVQLPDSGFVLAGQSTNGANGLDMYMVRTNLLGDTLWTSKFGTGATDNAEQIIRQADGTFVLAGGTDGIGFGGNDGYVVMTDSGGAVLWSKYYGGNSQDDFHQVSPTSDGGFVFGGTSRSSGTLDPNLWLVKTNASGDSLWTQTYGGDNNDHGYSGIQTADGGYIMVGYTSSFGFNGEEAYVVKSTDIGNIGNYMTYGTISALTQPLEGSCSSNDVQVRILVRNFGRDTIPNMPVTIQITGPITQTINETYLGAIFPGEVDTLAFSTHLDLSTPGQYTFDCTSSIVNDVFPQNNQLNTTVTIFASPTVNLGADTVNISTGQSVTLDAGAGFTSYFWSTGATTQTIIVSTSAVILVTVTDLNNCTASDTVVVNLLTGINALANQLGIEIFPNPSQGKFEINISNAMSGVELRLVDVIGREFFLDLHSGNGSYHKTVDLSSAAKGIYFLQMRTPEGTVTRRILIQ